MRLSHGDLRTGGIHGYHEGSQGRACVVVGGVVGTESPVYPLCYGGRCHLESISPRLILTFATLDSSSWVPAVFRLQLKISTMVRVLQPFSAVLAAVLSLDLAAADSCVSVVGDATYTIPSYNGICIGDGAAPTGTGCPLKGDVATDNCHEGIPSYKDGKCVAPKDAQCVIISGSTWGCAYPEDDCVFEKKC